MAAANIGNLLFWMKRINIVVRKEWKWACWCGDLNNGYALAAARVLSAVLPQARRLHLAKSEQDKDAVAKFAENLFGEEFSTDDIIFGTQGDSTREDDTLLKPQRFHLFISAPRRSFFTA